MKKYPFPDAKPANRKEAEEWLTTVFNNTLKFLNISGYPWFLFFPEDEGHGKSESSSLSILVKYPYKRFEVSVQQDTLEKMYKAKEDSFFWKNLEGSIFHECIHIILWDLGEIARKRYTTPTEYADKDEFVTDHLAAVFHDLADQLRTAKSDKIKKPAKASRSRARRTA